MKTYLFWVQLLLAVPFSLLAQTKQDSVLQEATLAQCIKYALQHQPVIQQSLLDESITEKTIQSKLADWYPQINFGYNYQHNFQLPAAYFSGNYVRTGTGNSSNLGFGLNQNIFNRDVLLASRTASDIRKQVKQNATFNKIDLAANVSKAFYDVLLTQKQVEVLDQAITRLERNLRDSYHQYQAGIVDKTDYKRASISLNNTKAQRKQVADLIVAKLSYLRQLMGYPDTASLKLNYDTAMIEKEAWVDTAATVQFENRIEYQQLKTQQRLQAANLNYYKWNFLPTLSAFGNYNMSYLNDAFSKLYNQTFANSNLGLQLSIPIFQGNKRVYQVKQAELQLKRVDWDIIALRSKIYTQYEQALAIYKGYYANYISLRDNVALADDVFKTIQLQYNSGIKTYLDVIVAESDLRTAQLNYYNALYELLQSKIDIQKALGNIQY
ncbi:MAG: TolC family protein [Bacteroidota bacterium]|nr:TolC family protein [Bacteroidota bacterium]